MSTKKQSGIEVLKKLEDLILFDQSKSSAWPRITIFVEAGGADPYQDDTITVYPNGRTYEIARAVAAPVPPEVVDVLQNSMTAIMVKDAKAATGYAPRDVLRFPFRIADSASQFRLDAWHKATALHRFVVTDTKPREVPTKDGTKLVHEVLARYLPDDKIDEAESVIAWVRDEIGKEKEKAAELKAAVA